jgi:hypothetical protein
MISWQEGRLIEVVVVVKQNRLVPTVRIRRGRQLLLMRGWSCWRLLCGRLFSFFQLHTWSPHLLDQLRAPSTQLL